MRMALGAGDRRGLNTWLAHLPMEAKEKDEWRYWQVDLLPERRRKAEAKEILHQLMQQRGLYPMAAAQRIGEGYELKIGKAPQNVDSALTRRPEVARVRELIYWSLDSTAHSEWANLVESKSKTGQAQLVRYVFSDQRWDLSVQAAIAGELWDHLEERFPLAYNDLFKRYTSGEGVPQSCMIAIARQESAWSPKMKSPVGASGLIQIIPGTATHIVRMFFIPGYNNPGQLLNPKTNINIGTSYLWYVYQQFGNNHIFFSAAYNAGLGRVRTWLGNSTGRIDAMVLIESVPSSETCSYVKNVLAYDVYYHCFMRGKPTLISTTEWGRRY